MGKGEVGGFVAIVCRRVSGRHEEIRDILV